MKPTLVQFQCYKLQLFFRIYKNKKHCTEQTSKKVEKTNCDFKKSKKIVFK